jgi:SAM-dependent methyltransferase
MESLRFTRRSFLGSALVLAAAPALAQRSEPELAVPYVPTPEDVVDKMLKMASVTGKDVVYDLGCGDGRIVITAAKQYGARGVGIDLNPQRIKEANENAKKAGVTDKVKFMVGDLFKANFHEATVVTLYLLPQVNVQLRPRLWQQLKVGTRVVSHNYDMGPEWPPEKTENVDHRTIYFWTVREAQKKAAPK